MNVGIGTRRAAPGARPRRLATLSRLLPAGVWGREWLVTLARPRALAMRVAMPLLLAVPLVAGGAPTFWAAMLLTVLVAMVGAVGSGMTMARARASGLLARLAVLPHHPWRTAGTWVLASSSIDLLQLLPATAVVVVGGGGGAAGWGALLLAEAAVLLVANVLGCCMALVAGGPGEVLLDVSVVLAPLLFLGGLFTGVPREGWRLMAARLDPFAYLHSAFIGSLGGSPTFDTAEVALTALGWGVVALAALGPIGAALLSRG